MSSIRSKVTSCGGEIVSIRRTLICELVLPAWPKLGEACVLPVEDLIIPELRDDFSDPYRCLLPEGGRVAKGATEKQSACHRFRMVRVSQGRCWA